MTVNFFEHHILTIQPDGIEGKDALISDLEPSTNYGNNKDLYAVSWICYEPQSIGRGLIPNYIMDNNTLTTTNIGKEELKNLRKIASHHGLKQVEFVSASISYFRKTGINPAEEIYSLREEIERLTKRVDEVIKLMQVMKNKNYHHC